MNEQDTYDGTIIWDHMIFHQHCQKCGSEILRYTVTDEHDDYFIEQCLNLACKWQWSPSHE